LRRFVYFFARAFHAASSSAIRTAMLGNALGLLVVARFVE
jgi:hypothetical protein